MQLINRILISITIAFILCVSMTAATVVALMFTKGQELGHHVGLFGGVFFEARETDTGTIAVGLGVENVLVLMAIFILVFVITIVSLSIYSQLKARKKFLEERMNDGQK